MKKFLHLIKPIKEDYFAAWGGRRPRRTKSPLVGSSGQRAAKIQTCILKSYNLTADSTLYKWVENVCLSSERCGRYQLTANSTLCKWVESVGLSSERGGRYQLTADSTLCEWVLHSKNLSSGRYTEFWCLWFPTNYLAWFFKFLPQGQFGYVRV